MSDYDEYEDAVVDTLEALLRETVGTTTQEDILLAAFDSHRIQSRLVHEARDRATSDETTDGILEGVEDIAEGRTADGDDLDGALDLGGFD